MVESRPLSRTTTNHFDNSGFVPMTMFRLAIATWLGLLVGCQLPTQSVPRATSLVGNNVAPAVGQGITALPATNGSIVRPAAYVELAEPPVAVVAPGAEPIEPVLRPEQDSLWDGELSLPQLEAIALGSNPSLVEAHARVDAARGKWLQVGLLPNTVVGYSGQQLGSNGQAEQHGLFIGQEIVRGGKLQLNRTVVEQEILKAEQLWSAQEQRVLTDVRLGYYEVLISQRRNEVTQDLVRIAEKAVHAADTLFRAQDVSRVDVVRARGALQMAQLLHKNARSQYVASWSKLLAVLGTPEMDPRPLVGDLEAAATRLDEHLLLQQLLVESPEMAAAVAEVERAQWAAERAYVEPIPNVDVQAVVQSDNGTGSNNANLQVSLPIPWFDYNQGGIRQAEAEIVAASHAVGRVELNLKRRLATVFQRYTVAHNQVEDYSRADGILSNAQQTLDFIQKGYEVGEVAYLELLTAQTNYSQTNLAYLEALGELWAARVEIEGLLLKDSLSQESATR